MFREIRRSERITDTDGRQTERDRLLAELFDCRIGSEDYVRVKAELDEFDKGNTPKTTFDPDARL